MFLLVREGFDAISRLCFPSYLALEISMPPPAGVFKTDISSFAAIGVEEKCVIKCCVCYFSVKTRGRFVYSPHATTVL